MRKQHLRALAHAALFAALFGAVPVSVASEGVPPVSITKTVFPNPARAGEQVTWTLRVLNSSSQAIANVRIADVLPPGVTGIHAAGPGFDCAVAGARVSCLAAELPAGISLVSITGTAQSSAAPAVAGPSIAARPGTITARSQVPDGIMDTVANLRLTIGSLEKERDDLGSQLSVMTTQHDQAQKQLNALSAELDSARVSRTDADVALDASKEMTRALEASVSAAKADHDRMAAELDTAAKALTAAQAELATARQSLDAKQGELDTVAMELSTLKGSLVMAEPLSFAVDCPAEATSQKWLLNNLPFLLDDAIANPTPRNARAFLCAQRAATTQDGFISDSRRPVSTPRFPAATPASSITDGKLHTHYQFSGAPTSQELVRLRAEAEAGSVQSLNDWGVLVLMGEGTPQDVDLGRQYIIAAANAGSAIAASNLAVVFELGVGVDPNRATASQWRRLAAANSPG